MKQKLVVNTEPNIQMFNNAATLDSDAGLACEKDSADLSETYSPTTYRWWKELFDRVSAFIAIVVLSPLMVLLAVIIKLDSRGNVIFRREQVGERGKRFISYKFRTMQSNNSDYAYKSYLVRYILNDFPYQVDQNGQSVYKVVNDPRVTKFGALLRKTNLDELPQLFNILKGDMSLIGPRPDIPFAVSMYLDWHKERLNIKPGITGLWQTSKRKYLSFSDMVRMDIEYIKKQSLWLDIKIALYTIRTIIKCDGS